MAQTTRSADLTSGPMLQKIILFSIPLAASSALRAARRWRQWAPTVRSLTCW